MTCKKSTLIRFLVTDAIKIFPCRIHYRVDAQWIYVPDERKPYHRILVRSNFCPGSRGYWTETRKERVAMFSEGDAEICFENEYAYPLNTIEKPGIMEELLQWCEKHRVYGLGRWGEHQHYNSDVTVERALMLAERLVNEK